METIFRPESKPNEKSHNQKKSEEQEDAHWILAIDGVMAKMGNIQLNRENSKTPNTKTSFTYFLMILITTLKQNILFDVRRWFFVFSYFFFPHFASQQTKMHHRTANCTNVQKGKESHR